MYNQFGSIQAMFLINFPDALKGALEIELRKRDG